ncbi:MAG: serine O-acetyltransferase [Actinomycetota bacterium]|jgi:serine O-acetyltransferase|nr:serine O-acetyltransferase [Actinomycetota bacterium]
MTEPLPQGLRGDIAKLLSAQGTHEGKPTVGKVIGRVLTRPGPLALVLYRLSHVIWMRGWQTAAELMWRVNLFLTGADIHPGAEIGPGLRITHTSGLVIGRGVRIGANVTILHEVTLGGAGRAFFDETFTDGFPVIGDETKLMVGAKVLGPVRVGKGCYVGANAVVTRDLPDGEALTQGGNVRELRKRVEALEQELVRLKDELASGAIQDDRLDKL